MINGIEFKVSSKHGNKHVDSRDGNLILLGGGMCVWEDYAEARKLFAPTGYNDSQYEIMCVNDIAGQFTEEKIHHAVSLHKRILPAVRLLRVEKSMLEKFTTHSNLAGDEVDVVWNLHNAGGTSGLYAVKIALLLGYKKIIVCGVPMDNGGHYYDPKDSSILNHTVRFASNKSSITPWRDLAKREIPQQRVRSMSGNTASILGKPTQEWAN